MPDPGLRQNVSPAVTVEDHMMAQERRSIGRGIARVDCLALIGGVFVLVYDCAPLTEGGMTMRERRWAVYIGRPDGTLHQASSGIVESHFGEVES